MKLLCTFCLVLFFLNSRAQKLLRGVVIDAEKNKPVQNASVFLNTTSIGTLTNEEGNFSLTIPSGRYELIVSSIGYETYTQSLNSNELTDFVTIQLKVKSQLMETVVVQPFEKDGWAKWGQFFLDNFIGTSAVAKNCKIRNTKSIHFLKSKTELTAVADEPLIIENKDLGYTIHYQLENFSYSFESRYIVYTGYPFFQPMTGNFDRQKKWERKRSEVYFGSMMHFMRSLYLNKIVEEGFDVRPLKKVLNVPFQTQTDTPSTHSNSASNINLTAEEIRINSYLDQMSHPDRYKDVIGGTIPGDSIAYAVNQTTAGLDFTDFLLIIYKKKAAPTEYQLRTRNGGAMMSQIILLNGKPIEVQANGNYYNPVDLMSTGYWAWSEKIAMMLPFDYVPSKQ